MDEKKPQQIPAEVKRSNETIGIVPKTGRITVVVRRLFNVLLYVSQREGPKELYRRPLGELAKLAEFTSSDLATLKEHLVAMNLTPVEWNERTVDEARWGTTTLITQAEIIEKRGVGTFVEWALPPKIRGMLLDPEQYTRLSLQIHSTLKSGASVALYEICARYLTNPGGLTMRKPWEWWRPRITGNPDPEAYPIYKYFKRDVLKPAAAEVTALSDIKVDLIEHKDGRRVADIQFKVERKAIPGLELESGKPFDGELLERIIRLGITQRDARALYNAHEVEFLRKTVELTEKRALQEPPLRSKAAFFKKALKERYADAQEQEKPAKALPPPSAEARRADAMARFHAHRNAEALAAYRELDAEQQLEARNRFVQATEVARYKEEVRKRSLTSPAVIAAFSEWYATQLWGTPGEADVLDFMMTHAELKVET